MCTLIQVKLVSMNFLNYHSLSSCGQFQSFETRINHVSLVILCLNFARSSYENSERCCTSTDIHAKHMQMTDLLVARKSHIIPFLGFHAKFLRNGSEPKCMGFYGNKF